PHQNVLVTGTSDDLMVQAANALADIGGGVIVISGSRVVRSWPLPLMGIFSDEPLAQAAGSLDRINDAIRDLGCPYKSPVLSLAFFALTTIPSYGLTERGLYDVEKGRFVPVVVGGREHL